MIITTVQPLMYSGSKDLKVDGTTPKAFSYSPSSGTVVVIGLSCLLHDEGSSTLDKFGSITALTNGVLLQWNVNGGNTTLYTLKTNMDVCQTFPYHQHFGNSAVLSILSVVTPQGFGNTNNIFKGTIIFNTPVILTGTDSISATVQDNLSNIDHFQIAALCEQDI